METYRPVIMPISASRYFLAGVFWLVVSLASAVIVWLALGKSYPFSVGFAVLGAIGGFVSGRCFGNWSTMLLTNLRLLYGKL